MPQARTLLLSLLLTTASASTTRAAEGWLQDFEAAKAQARKEGKDILIDFTGSDWCGYCIRLHREVFSKPAFLDAIPKKFVLLELDFPRRRKLPPRQAAHNRKLQKLFGVRGYPSVFLTDAEGRPYAKTGYRPGGAASYVQHLEVESQKRIARDKLFAQGRKAGGTEGAVLLDRAISNLQQSKLKLVGYEPLFDEIARLDKDDKAGLRSKYLALAGRTQVEALYNEKQFAAGIKRCDELLEKLTAAEPRQTILFYKAYGYQGAGDTDRAIELLRKSIDVAPKSQRARAIRNALRKLERQAAAPR